MALSTSQVVGVGLLGGAVFFYFKPAALTGLLEGIGLSPQQADDLTAKAGLPVAPRVPQVNAVSALSAGAAAGSAAGPIGIAIGAGVAGITYAITELGIGRGGWEGVKGNTIRDRFLDQFVQAYFPGSGIERQYDAMVKALEGIGIVGSGEPGSSSPNAGDMIRMIYSADRADEMRQAVSSWANLFYARAKIRLAIPPDDAY